MTHPRPPQEVGEFLIARVIKCNSGPVMETVMHGSWNAVMENIKDSKVRADAIRADQAKDKKIAALEKQLTRANARADSAETEIKRIHSEAVVKALMTEAVNKLDGLASRMDTLEQSEQQRQLEEDLVYPPDHVPEVEADEEDPDDPPGDHEDDEEDLEEHPSTFVPSGDLHPIQAKTNGTVMNGHVRDSDDDDEMEVLPKSPLPKPETTEND
jgi:hypothetical protein